MVEIANTAGTSTRQDPQVQTKQETELGREQIRHANVNIDHERWHIHKTGQHSTGEEPVPVQRTHGVPLINGAAQGLSPAQQQNLQDFMLEGNPRIKGRLQELKEKYPELGSVINAAAHINVDPQQLDKQMPELKKAIQSSKGLEAEKALENIVKAVNDDGVLKLEMAKRGAEAQATFDKSIAGLQQKLELNNREAERTAKVEKVDPNPQIHQQTLEQILNNRAPELKQSLDALKQRSPDAETVINNLSAIKTDPSLNNYPQLKQALENRNNLNPDQKIDSIMQAMQADGLLRVVGEQRGAQARADLEQAMSRLQQQLNQPREPQIRIPQSVAQQTQQGATVDFVQPPLVQTAATAVVAGQLIQNVNNHRHNYQALDAAALRQMNTYLDSRLAEGQKVDSWQQLKRDVSHLSPDAATIVKDVETQARMRAQQEQQSGVDRNERARHMAEISRIASERGANLAQAERQALNRNMNELYKGDKKIAKKKLTKMEQIKEKLKDKKKLTARERMLLREQRKRDLRAKRVVVDPRELRPERPGRLSRAERRKAARSRREA